MRHWKKIDKKRAVQQTAEHNELVHTAEEWVEIPPAIAGQATLVWEHKPQLKYSWCLPASVIIIVED
jgi:hypothetical protein